MTGLNSMRESFITIIRPEILIDFREYGEWVSDLETVEIGKQLHQEALSSRIVSGNLRELLALRMIVLRLFLQLAIEVDGEFGAGRSTARRQNVSTCFHVTYRAGHFLVNHPRGIYSLHQVADQARSVRYQPVAGRGCGYYGLRGFKISLG